MRVLIASHACSTADNQRLFQIATERRGWDTHLLLPGSWHTGYGRTLFPELVHGFQASLVKAPVLCSGSVPFHIYLTRMCKLIRALRPDLIYVHNEPYSMSALQLALANRMTLRCPIGFYSAQNIEKRYPAPFAQAERWIYRQSAFAFPITKSVESVLRNKGYRGMSTILSVGYDGTAYRCEPAAAQERHARAKGAPTRFAYIGRFVEEKGLNTLFDALQRIGCRPWVLRMIGGGHLESVLRAKAAKLGIADRIEWVGFKNQIDMPGIYSDVDVVVLPSETRPNWKEQFGRVLVEAMASGTPVLGSDSGEIPDVINECGGGLIFKEGDVESLARRLTELLEHPDSRAALAAQGCVGARSHAWDRLADRFADTLEAAASAIRS